MNNKFALPKIAFYNSLSKQIEALAPLEANKVRIYCCGPTVYNYQHIGNLRTYIFEDVLVRVLRYAGYEVLHVMNITDVGHLVSDADEGEDKMLLAAKRERKTSHEIAEYYTAVFLNDCRLLNISRPSVICKATEHIAEMIELIRRLEANGMAYQAGGNVYFDVSKFSTYGKLAGLDLAKLQAGARIEVDPNKRSPLDFALWFTKSKFENQELLWDSPWGLGYPGWHIECSAMSMKYCGETFDIHCGGIDHIPVHHTNEIAQSEGATQKPLANIWMHGGFLLMGQEKMSKSKGSFLTLGELVEQGFCPMSFRLLALGGIYRNELSFSLESLKNASYALEKLKSTVLALREEVAETGQPIEPASESNEFAQLKTLFCEAVYCDLGLPKAMSVLHQVVNSKTLSAAEKLSLIENFDLVLGLDVKSWRAQPIEIPHEIAELVNQRDEARKNRLWDLADELRRKIELLGFAVEDAQEKTKIVKKKK
ncbi:MAG: cysteine--tRNA ligase [Deltaproteobacteria bacterium]|nr:cysteine--tRNA ligase [Deltaproteobacteria bacterium]